MLDEGCIRLVKLSGESQIRGVENLYKLSSEAQMENLEEAPGEFQPPSKRLRRDEDEQPQTPEDKVAHSHHVSNV
jgi:hypothetical protein